MLALTAGILERALEKAAVSGEDNDVRQRAIGICFDELRVLHADGVDPTSDRGALLLGRAIRKELGINHGGGRAAAAGAAKKACQSCGRLFVPVKPHNQHRCTVCLRHRPAEANR